MSVINKIGRTFDRFMDVPVADPDDARRRKLLNIITSGIMFLSLLLVLGINVVALFNSKLTGLLQVTLVGLIIFIVSFFFYSIDRIQRIPGWIIGFSFLLFLTIAISFSDTPKEVSSGQSLFAFTIPIILGSVLLAPWSSFIFSTIISIIISIIAVSIDRLPNTPAIVGFFFLAFISWLSSRSLEQALKDLRIINANLDQIVKERTLTLADALARERIESGRNQAILNSIADGVIVFDANNTAILANPSLSRITGAAQGDLIGIDLNQFISTEQIPLASRDTMAELIKHPEKNVGAVRIEWGQKILSASMAHVQVSADEYLGTVTVFRDVTQEALLEKMKETFVATVSHELRTPLNAIMAYSEILKEAIYGPLNEKQTTITERIMVNVTRLLSMVSDLLDDAQIRAGKLSINPQEFKPASLLESIHESMDKTVKDKGLSLTCEMDPEMPEKITGDPHRILQIITNLVGNATKFTESGGIRVMINQPEPDYWKIEVSDSGVGIPKNELPYIFDTFRQANNLEFTTRQHGGIGLGLSIVQQLVKLMKGRILVKSEVGKGSTFTVLLPLEVR